MAKSGARQFAVEFIAKTAGWQKATAEASGSLGKVGKAADQSADQLERAQASMQKAVEGSARKIEQANERLADASAKVEIAEKKKAEAIAKYGEDSSQAATAVLKLEQAERSASAAKANVTKATNEQKTAQERLAEVSERLEKAQKGVTDEAGKGASVGGKLKAAWGDAVQGFTGASGGADSLAGKLGGLAAVAGASMAVAAQLGAAWEQAWDKSGGVSTLTAQLGLNADEAERAGDAASELFRTGYGANIGEATSAIGSVMSSIEGLRGASADTLEDVTGRAMGFAEVFGVDVSEAARNAGILIANGLAPDAVTAFDLMSASLQQVPEALRGEVMDATQEYGQFFAQLGYTGSEALALIGLTAATDGQYGIDKMGDAIKEFTIRATDGSAASTGAFETLGLDAQAMANSILAGGDTAAGALDQIVSGLLGIEDPAMQAQTAVALFGTPLEDLGQDGLPAFLASLQGAGNGLGDVAGKSDDMKLAVEESLSPIESLQRSLTTTVSEGLEPFVGPAEKISEWAANNPGALKAVTVGLGLMAGAMAVATAAMWAMSLTPMSLIIGGIVLAVGLLVAGIVALAKNWDTIWGGIQSAAQAVGDWFAGPFAGFFTGVWDTITGAFTAAKDWIVGKLQDLWDWVSGVFSGLWQGIVDVFAGPIDTVRKIVEVFGAAIWMGLQWAWDKVVAGATWLWDRMVAIWTAIGDWLSPYIEGIKTWVTEKWTALVDGVTAAVTWLRDKMSEIWTNISDRVRGLVQPLVDWATNTFNSLRDRVVDTFTNLKDRVVGVVDGMKEGIRTAWDAIKAVFSTPVRWVADIVVNPLIRGFNKLADKVGMSGNKLDEWVFEGFYSGGYTGPGTKYQPAGIVHAGEIVWSQDDIKRHGGISRVEAMRTGGGAGYASGGVVQPVPYPGRQHLSGYPWATWAGDFAAPMGTPIKSWKDGVVALVKYLTSSYGYHARVNHDDGSSSLYAHMSRIIVSAGQRLAAGQILGYVGSTGNSTGPHLHFETSGAPYAGGDSGGGGFDLLGAITSFITGPMDRLKEMGDGGFAGLVKGLPGKIVEGMRSKLMAGWDAVSGVAKAGGNYALASAMAATRGWGPGDIASLLWLITKESGGRVDATNPSSGAYGIPQALPGSKMASAGADWRTNPATQIRWMLDYITQRYGSASAAKSFHQAHNWYDQGGWLNPGLTLAMNGTGETEAILTAPQWAAAEKAISLAAAGHTGRSITVEKVDMHVTVDADDLEGVRNVLELFEGLGFEARLEKEVSSA